MNEPRRDEAESEAFRAFRAIYEEGNRAWNEGDFKRAYGALPEDFEYHLAATWPQARPLCGPDEIVEFFEDFRHAFPDTRTGPLTFIEVDARTMIVGFTVTGTGRSSGLRTAMEIWQVWEGREVAEPPPGGAAVGALVPVRVREFEVKRAALDAAGAENDEEQKG